MQRVGTLAGLLTVSVVGNIYQGMACASVMNQSKRLAEDLVQERKDRNYYEQAYCKEMLHSTTSSARVKQLEESYRSEAIHVGALGVVGVAGMAALGMFGR